MNTDNSKTIIRWSKIATVLFIGLVIVMDAVALIVARYISYCWAEKTDNLSVGIIAGSIWAGTIAGFAILVSVYKLLSNMEKDEVFETKNTKLMGVIVGGLIGAGVCAIVGGFVWNGSFCLTIAAWFMALIVLSVKVVFDKAILMKNELDLTI